MTWRDRFKVAKAAKAANFFTRRESAPLPLSGGTARTLFGGIGQINRMKVAQKFEAEALLRELPGAFGCIRFEKRPVAASRFRDGGGGIMLYLLGRFLQLVGLIIVPLAISGEINRSLELKDSLWWSAIGVLVFFAGVLVQKMGKKP